MASTNFLRVTYPAATSGAQTPLSIDWRDDVPSGYSYEVQFNAGASGSVTVETTLDDVNDATITPDWIAETTAITTDTRGVIGHPVQAMRLNISSLTGGSLTFKALGGSVIGDTSGTASSGGGPATNVNVLSVIPGVGATNLGKAEDAAHVSGDVGVMMLGVRNDAGTTFGADLDYVPLRLNAAGEVGTFAPGVVSSVNSSTTPLGSGGVFTGTSTGILNYGSITVSVFANQASAANGLSIQQSPDGTNWDQTDTFTISASTGRTFTVPRQGSFLRIVYTNGGSAQATFRLQTILNQPMPAPSAIRPSDAVTIENDFQEVYSTVGVYNGTTLDLQRAVTNGTNSTGTGITSAGLVAQFDDVSPTAISENSFGNVRMNASRALYVEEGPFLFGRVTADGQIKGSAGFIHTISIAPLTATPTAGLLTVYNSLTETGTVVYSEWVFATTVGHTVVLDVPCSTGIFVGFDATLANVQVTVSYR